VHSVGLLYSIKQCTVRTLKLRMDVWKNWQRSRSVIETEI
jgi:hypothetical protein